MDEQLEQTTETTSEKQSANPTQDLTQKSQPELPATPPPTSTRASHAKDIVLLFAVPIVIALTAFGILYVPRFFANPSYDFIYSSCNDYLCKNTYSVNSDGKIYNNILNQNIIRERDKPVLRYYSTKDDASRPLTTTEARRYTLDTSTKSPDGYTLKYETSGGGGFIFWGGDYSSSWYLADGPKKKPINLEPNKEYYYDDDITFLGWVE